MTEERPVQVAPTPQNTSAPQEWWSEIEVDERRASLVGNLTANDSSWTGDGARLKAAVSKLIAASWFRALRLKEVEELTAIEGWEWSHFLAWDDESEWEGDDEPTLNNLVEFHLVRAASSLIAYGSDWLCEDLLHGGDQVNRNVRVVRHLAETYGFDLAAIVEREQRTY